MRFDLGASHGFDALLYGEQNQGTLQFLQEQVANIPQTLTESGRAFMQGAVAAFDFFNGEAAMNYARQVAAKASRLFQSDYIVPIWDLSGFQQASVVSQRWIMAFPQVREMFHAQRCDGFSETYYDAEPGRVGEQHYDWRRANDGLLVEKDGQEFFVEYPDVLHEGDRHLELAEQRMILRNWDSMQILLMKGEDDPTSPVGGYL